MSVRGELFSPTPMIVCKVQNEAVATVSAATFVSSTLLRCSTPPVQFGQVQESQLDFDRGLGFHLQSSVSVSLDGGDAYLSASGSQYLYLSPPSISTLDPFRLPLGSVLTSAVRVSGRAFAATTELACRLEAQGRTQEVDCFFVDACGSLDDAALRTERDGCVWLSVQVPMLSRNQTTEARSIAVTFDGSLLVRGPESVQYYEIHSLEPASGPSYGSDLRFLAADAM